MIVTHERDTHRHRVKKEKKQRGGMCWRVVFFGMICRDVNTWSYEKVAFGIFSLARRSFP